MKIEDINIYSFFKQLNIIFLKNKYDFFKILIIQ